MHGGSSGFFDCAIKLPRYDRGMETYNWTIIVGIIGIVAWFYVALRAAARIIAREIKKEIHK